MNDFLTMGGYGAYVWPAYAAFVIVLAFDALAPLFARKRLVAELRGRWQRRAARAGKQP